MVFGVPNRIDVKYSPSAVENMLALLRASPFPDQAPIDTAEPWKLGIDYAYLKNLKTRFETEWDWTVLEQKIARFDNYLVHYEHEGDALDLHYIHVKSARSDAIPLILLHGWPGTFFDFNKVIDPLVNPPNVNLPAFNVVVPSIPGYFLSTLPRRDGWSPEDTARMYHGLMTTVLGYKTYAGQGGDWGYFFLRIMGSLFPESLLVSHFNMFVARPAPDLEASNYSEYEKRLIKRRQEFGLTGRGYSILQNTKPFTIGLAIASSPLAVLAYIGEKIYAWSDPDRVNPQDILDTVALYYLSSSFATSVIIYNQGILDQPPVKGVIGYSSFPFEIVTTIKAEMEIFAPGLVYFKEHSSGGHFPAMDSPKEYVEDLREFLGEHWVKG
ncbi:hypothetical protein M0805_001659 [Coniferiporia weirii]|nr:hypothetical protein M0805_001659 [Coniferiporia weirii]